MAFDSSVTLDSDSNFQTLELNLKFQTLRFFLVTLDSDLIHQTRELHLIFWSFWLSDSWLWFNFSDSRVTLSVCNFDFSGFNKIVLLLQDPLKISPMLPLYQLPMPPHDLTSWWMYWYWNNVYSWIMLHQIDAIQRIRLAVNWQITSSKCSMGNNPSALS